MVGVGVILAVGDTGQDAKLLAVTLGELATQTLGRRSEDGVVVVILLRELVGTVAHVGHDPQSQLLCLLALAMMMTGEGHKTFGQSDKADTKRALVDNPLNGVLRLELLCSDPEILHEHGELLGQGSGLELEAVVELMGRHIEHFVELLKELVHALLLVLNTHTLDGELHDIDSGETEVATAYARLRSESVLEDTGAASHRGDLPTRTVGIVSTPVLILVEGGIEVEEIGEEAARRHLASELVEVIIRILRQIVDASLLLPNLDGEDGRLAIAHALIGRFEYLAHHTTAFGRSVGAIIDGGEDDLIATTGVDRIHIVDERLHGLVDAAHSLVDGKLEQALIAIETVKRSLQIVLDLCRAEIIETATLKLLQRPHFLLVGIAHIGSEVEVESRNGLTSVHLVLTSLQGDASQYGCRLDALGRTGRSVTCRESVAQDDVERMLHTGERLGGIIVLVVDVEIVVLHSQTRILREQVVVHERLGVSEANFIIMPAGVSAFMLAFSRVMSFFFALTMLMKISRVLALRATERLLR